MALALRLNQPAGLAPAPEGCSNCPRTRFPDSVTRGGGGVFASGLQYSAGRAGLFFIFFLSATHRGLRAPCDVRCTCRTFVASRAPCSLRNEGRKSVCSVDMIAFNVWDAATRHVVRGTGFDVAASCRNILQVDVAYLTPRRRSSGIRLETSNLETRVL